MFHRLDPARHLADDFIAAAARTGLTIYPRRRDMIASSNPSEQYGRTLSPEEWYGWMARYEAAQMLYLPGWSHVVGHGGFAWVMNLKPSIGIKWQQGTGWFIFGVGVEAITHLPSFLPEPGPLIDIAHQHAGTPIDERDLIDCVAEDFASPIPFGPFWWFERYPDHQAAVTEWIRRGNYRK